MRAEVKNYIKSRDKWPEGLTHPTEFRQFYWTNDMALCGFASQYDQ